MPSVFSIWAVLGLVLVLVVSWVVFWAHVHRWTHGQRWGALRDWAGNNSFVLQRAGGTAPMPLDAVTQPPPVVCIALVGKSAMFLQIQTPPDSSGLPSRWNVLVREIDIDWPATALRPFGAPTSLVDFFALGGFPALMSSDRFTLHGHDPLAARMLAKSSTHSLLPQDLGLVLIGRRLVIDFSRRQFDGIELSRVLSLSEQLMEHLPAMRMTPVQTKNSPA